MTTPVMVAVATPPPLTPNHVAYAARLQAQREAAQAGNFVAQLPRKVASAPHRLAQWLRLPQFWDRVRGAAGGAGRTAGRALGPVGGFIARVGLLPSGIMVVTGDAGQAFIRWMLKQAWRPVAWLLTKSGHIFDGILRLFGRPGNAAADKLVSLTARALISSGRGLGVAYGTAAPLVSSKSGHIKLINRGARLVVVHRVLRIALGSHWWVWPIELIVAPLVIGKLEAAVRRSAAAAAAAEIKATELKNEAKARKAAADAQARVDAHIAADAKEDAKVAMHTAAEARKDTTISEAASKIGEGLERVAGRADEVLAQDRTEIDVTDEAIVVTMKKADAPAPAPQTSTEAQAPVELPADNQVSSITDEGEQVQPVQDSAETEVNGAGHPATEEDALVVELRDKDEAAVYFSEDATSEEVIAKAQATADQMGVGVVAALPDGGSRKVEPTGTGDGMVAEHGPELGEETPEGSRDVRRAAQKAQRRAQGRARAGTS